jgi:hypothetical protein
MLNSVSKQAITSNKILGETEVNLQGMVDTQSKIPIIV